jgi:pyruvate dehydrogenase E2 component (dihydrolipoamide acetyltransferase)
VHRIRDMPVVINGEIKPRKILPLVLSFDHRVLDGAQAARFMNNLIEHLKDPDLFLLDVV